VGILACVVYIRQHIPRGIFVQFASARYCQQFNGHFAALRIVCADPASLFYGWSILFISWCKVSISHLSKRRIIVVNYGSFSGYFLLSPNIIFSRK
jgi:hypothetical protein